MEMNEVHVPMPPVGDGDAQHAGKSKPSLDDVRTSSQSLEIVIENVGFSVAIKDQSVKQPRFGQKVMVDKQILKGVSGLFKAGRLTAVMGASGAGKTSLLNVLSGEIGKGKVSGAIKVNGTTFSNDGKQMKEISGFVFQDDVILQTMTVREAVMMSARLRLPQDIPLEEKQQRVENLLSLLQLTKCANTVIGSSMQKGISGGERKRTAVAMEMVTGPSLLFLDEPTSGLDTFTAFNVVDILKGLAKSGRTVVATIHQPSSETFHMFDDLCLLAEGRVMYFGPVHDVVSYFAGVGYQCPNYTNPADFLFMSILNTEKTDKADQEANAVRIKQLLDAWPNSEPHSNLVKAMSGNGKQSTNKVQITPKYHSDFSTQFGYLFGRAAKNAVRNKFIVQVKFMQSLFIALLVGLIYRDVNSKEFNEQVQNRTGALFFVCVNMVMGSSIGVLSIFAQEKAVFHREYLNGYYSVASYFITKTLVELPVQIIFPFIQTIVLYWLVGFNTNTGFEFLVFAVTVMLLSACGTSLGIFFASIFQELQLALAVTPMVLLPLMIFSGLFVNNDSIPVYFDWIKYISPIKWGFEALAKNEFYGLELNGPGGVKVKGETVIRNLGLDDGLAIETCLLLLFAMYVMLVALAFFALQRNIKK
eukprot:Partr_v1_DN28287_c0_g1_i1_m76207 putative ATP-binding cassette, sub-family G (WHITE), member